MWCFAISQLPNVTQHLARRDYLLQQRPQGRLFRRIFPHRGTHIGPHEVTPCSALMQGVRALVGSPFANALVTSILGGESAHTVLGQQLSLDSFQDAARLPRFEALWSDSEGY